MTAAPVLSVRGIHRRFGGVHALRGVDLDLPPGRVTAIVGENGAGKSTLMKVLAGAEQPDEGHIAARGTRIAPRNVAEANRHGISIVFQELSLYPHLSVGANIVSRREPWRAGIVDVRATRRLARRLLARLGAEIDPDAVVGDLPLAQQQLVEIAKALASDAAVLILDEPNSALRPAETQRLFAVVDELRRDGVAIVLVSHRLEEVFSVADDVAVLRSGELVSHRPVRETSISAVVTEMLGPLAGAPVTAAPERAGPARRPDDERVLRMAGVSVPGRLDDLTLEVGAGEIVGLAGLDGAGHSAVLDVLFGRVRATGTITLPHGRPPARSPRQAVARGIAFVPSDRKTDGLMLAQSCADNLAHVRTGALGRRGGLVRPRELLARAVALREELRIRMADPALPAHTLSGGNQQKLVFGKWWSMPHDLVLLDDPTRGVDVGGKGEIYRLVERLAGAGSVVLVVSSDLRELAELCDRVLIFHGARCTGSIDRAGLDHSTLLHAINAVGTQEVP